MRKNSNQILDEIKLERTLNQFEFREELDKAIFALTNFEVNELDGMLAIEKLTRGNPILTKYVTAIMTDHARKICTLLGVTIEGFKMEIEEIERQKQLYDKIRNGIVKQMDNEPKEIV